MRRFGSVTLFALTILAWAACSDGPSGPEPPTGDALAPVILSNPLGTGAAPALGARGSGGSAAVAFVSLSPGSVPGAASVLIQNVTAGGDPTAVPVVDGGFDPVPIVAAAGDSLELEFRDGAGGILGRKYGSVPHRRPPVIVRTSPPEGRTDVALGIRPTVVFSEPVDPATVGAAVRLLQDGTPMGGDATSVPGEPWVVEFIPAAALEPATEYRLEVGQGVLDSDGDPLPSALAVDFVTTATPVPPGPQPTGTEQIAFVSTRGGGPRIYLANSDGSGVVELTVGESPAWSWDGQRIAFNRGSNLYVINADGSGEQFVAGNAFHPSWSPNGSTLALVEYTGDLDDFGTNIGIINADGQGRTVVVNSGFRGTAEYMTSPTWSPDGRFIAFVTPIDWYTGPRRVYVLDLEASSVPQLFPGDGGPYVEYREDPAWSPDGARLAFGTVQFTPGDETNPPSPFWAVASLRSDGTEALAVHFAGPTDPRLWAGDPDWSPDGRRIAFTMVHEGVTSQGGTPTRIRVVDLETGQAAQLIPEAPGGGGGYSDSQVAWSRTGP